MDDWGKWFRDLTGGVVNMAAQHQYVMKPQIEAQKWAALGELGMYREGQPGTVRQGGVDPTILLIGAAVVAVLMLKD